MVLDDNMMPFQLPWGWKDDETMKDYMDLFTKWFPKAEDLWWLWTVTECSFRASG